MAMTMKVACNQKEHLVGFLYDEVTPAERAAIEAHLAACAACRREVEELRGVRGHLAGWTPPEPELGFRIVRDAPPRARWTGWRAPAWGFGLAAAATLVLAAAAAVAHLEVRYDAQGVTVRTGWRAPAAEPVPLTATAVPALAPGTVTGEPWRAEFQALEQRLRREIRATPIAAPAATAPGQDALRRVSTLISESEARQQREIALQIARLVRDLDEQRRTDWVRISQGFGRLESLTGAGQVQQREMMNYLMRVSQQR
jgi:hypothetical protein